MTWEPGQITLFPASTELGNDLVADQTDADARLDEIVDHGLAVRLDDPFGLRVVAPNSPITSLPVRAWYRRDDPGALGERFPRRLEQFAGPGDGHRHPVDDVAQRDAVKIGFGLGAEIEAGVERAAAYPREGVARHDLNELELDLRIAIPREHQQVADTQHRRDEDGAELELPVGAPRNACAECLRCSTASMICAASTRSRRPDGVSAIPVDDRSNSVTPNALQGLDVTGNRRLAQMQGLGRPCEVTELGNGNERAQLIEIQRFLRHGLRSPLPICLLRCSITRGMALATEHIASHTEVDP